MTLKIILILLILYVVFILGPAVVVYFMMFRPSEGRSFDNTDYTGTYYEPYLPVLIPAYARMKKREYREVKMDADGITLTADLLVTGSKKTAILFHGYHATPLMNFALPGEFLLKEDRNLLLIHERAHGKSGGKLSGMGLLEQEDVLKWIAYAKNTLGAEDIVLWGMSMGCTALSYASSKIDDPSVTGLILDCGFVSPKAQILSEGRKRHLPNALIYPVIAGLAKLISGIDLSAETIDSVKKNRIPALFLHGEADTSVPVEDTLRAYEACTAEKELFTVPGAGHTLAFVAGGVKAEETVRRFLNKNILKEEENHHG